MERGESFYNIDRILHRLSQDKEEIIIQILIHSVFLLNMTKALESQIHAKKLILKIDYCPRFLCRGDELYE